jgi:hypothetical protein
VQPEHELLPTVPASYQMNLQGFQDESYARQLGETIANFLLEISRDINAERLDGVTVAYDYDQALVSLDRGLDGLQPLTRSTEHATGVAMSPPVLRDGVVKGHIVLYAACVEPLLDESHKLYRDAIYLLAHEMGHLHDLKAQDEAFPETILRCRYKNAFDNHMFPMLSCCWDEYAASRLSAPFSVEQVKNYEETFVSMLAKAKEETDREIMAYRLHADVTLLLQVATNRYGNLLKYAAYLIGHLHGMNGNLHADAPRASSALDGAYFERTYRDLEATLSDMWNSYGNWSSKEVYNELT